MVDQPVVKISTSRISSDAFGFSNVARMHQDLANLSSTKVTLDFSRLAWIDGHLAASLHVIFLHAKARSISFQFEGLSPTVAAIRTIPLRNGMRCVLHRVPWPNFFLSYSRRRRT